MKESFLREHGIILIKVIFEKKLRTLFKDISKRYLLKIFIKDIYLARVHLDN